MKTDNVVKEVRSGNEILRIFRQESPESPRDWDNLGVMICEHRRYNLGDKNTLGFKFDDFDSFAEVKQHLIDNFDACVVLPIFMYDHSGITIKTTPFGCNFDSGQVGLIFITNETVKKEFAIENIDEEAKKKMALYLEGEVETYDQYLTGEVYGFEVVKTEKCNLGCEHEEITDSCGGFFGSDFLTNGITDHISNELAEALKTA